MSNFGFGPLGQNASTTRPAASANTFAVQTWFTDATSSGANDGTVLDASWLNHILANFVHLCVQAGVEISNDQSTDHWVYDAVKAMVDQEVTVQTDAANTIGNLSDVTDSASVGQILIKQSDGTWAPDTTDYVALLEARLNL